MWFNSRVAVTIAACVIGLSYLPTVQPSQICNKKNLLCADKIGNPFYPGISMICNVIALTSLRCKKCDVIAKYTDECQSKTVRSYFTNKITNNPDEMCKLLAKIEKCTNKNSPKTCEAVESPWGTSSGAYWKDNVYTHYNDIMKTIGECDAGKAAYAKSSPAVGSRTSVASLLVLCVAVVASGIQN